MNDTGLGLQCRNSSTVVSSSLPMQCHAPIPNFSVLSVCIWTVNCPKSINKAAVMIVV